MALLDVPALFGAYASADPVLLAFDRAEEEDCESMIDAMDEDQSAPWTAPSTIGYDAASGCFSLTESSTGAGRPFGLLFPTNNITKKKIQKMQQRVDATTTTRRKTTMIKDPQSLAAKNRRERISERLRTLQELVPNGTKVDMVTMLDKAISYVKFLQLQVKVLATDDFWAAEEGKAPEIYQEALDAILSSSSSQKRQMNYAS